MSGTTVIVDFNNLAFRSFFIKGVDGHTVNPDYTLWRYVVYEGIFGLLRNINNVKELIIAVDDKNSWRKAYFPRYKESRKKNRDKNKDVDWATLFKNFSDYVSDLKHHMPFKVIKLKSCEADDIIAVIAMNINNDVVISSNDEDFTQICSDRIKVWNPKNKEYIKCDNPETFLLLKFLIGQRKDDIFNVKTPSDWGLTEKTKGKRKPGFGPKSAEKVLKNENLEKWLEENELEDNFRRNQVLIDFNCIPNTIRKRIMNTYTGYSFPPPSNIYKFFKKHNMRGFLDDFTMVENTLRQLY